MPEDRRAGEPVIGQIIADYQVLTKLEDSGAYATYLAKDVRDESQERKVVLKVLPSSLVGTEKARQRLAQAVRTFTTLNHPNLCRVHRIETFDFRTVIIREYVEGSSLLTQLERGRVEVEEAVSMLVQMARAIDAAHKRGVVHRNLKPSNVFTTNGKGGRPTVKIADFGFLHLLEPGAGSLSATSHPTITYTSPEEALRAVVDHRSDIWSMGVLLFEMLTGKPPFRSKNAAAELLAILKDEYEPIRTRYPDYPKSLDWILGRCLAKNPNQRYQTASELASEIGFLAEGKQVDEAPSAATSSTPEPPVQTPAPEAPSFASPEPRAFPWAATILGLVGIGIIFAVLFVSPEPVSPRLRKYAIAAEEFGIPEGRAVISPDGQSVAYIAGHEQTKLWIQDLSQDQPREIAGTNGATRPFWSPDGQWLGFLAGNAIKKVSVADSSIVEICPIAPRNDSFSASWSHDGTAIMFTAGSPSELFRVPADGGQPKSILQAIEGAGPPTFVHCLPSSSRLGSVLLAGSRGEGDVHVYDLRTGDQKSLGFRAASIVYSPGGHVLFQRNDPTVFAVPISLDSMKTTGDAFPVQERASWPSVSMEGTLVYRREGGPWLKQLIWRDRRGKNVGTIGKEWGTIRQVALSRDGSRLAILASDEPGSTATFWTYDQTGAVWSAGQADDKVRSITMSTSGDRALLSADVDGAVGIYVHRVGASSRERQNGFLRGDATSCDVTDWSSYGRYIICNRKRAEGTSDLWRLTYDPDRGRFRESVVVESAFDDRDGAISPDSRWVAFLSNRTGRHETYIARFPSGASPLQISTEGGTQPRWGRDSSELFYVSGGTLVAVSLQTEPEIAVSGREVLFSDPELVSDPFSGERRYDFDPGRERFLTASTVLADGGAPATIRIAENWIEEFRPRD